MFLECYCLTEFSFNYNQINLNQLIKVFRLLENDAENDFWCRVATEVCRNVVVHFHEW